MADNYIPGDYYTTCDRTGFKIRASKAKREWTGALVREESWEPRHPQDFVRGLKDDMAAPGIKQVPLAMGPLTTIVTAYAGVAATSIVVESSERFAPGDRITIMLDNKDTMINVVLAVPDLVTLQLVTKLPMPILVGGAVTNYSAVSPPDIG